MTNLSDICDRIVDGSHNPPNGVQSGFAMLSARNINNQQIVFDDFRWIGEADFAVEHARTRVKPGDVLLTIVGTIGRTAVVPNHVAPFALQRSVAVLKPAGVDPRYLAYVIDAPVQQRWLIGNAKGTAQKGIYLKALGSAQIPLAPAAEQTRIVDKLEELLSDLNAGVAELKAAQKKLAQYRQSLFKAAIEGRLTEAWRAQHGEPEESGAQLLARILRERRARWEAKQLAKFAAQGKVPIGGWQEKYPVPATADVEQLPELPAGWAWTTADALIADIETGKSFKCEERPPRVGEIGVAKVSAVSWGEYNEQESKTCVDASKVNASLFVRAGDFLFSRANTIELVGACVIARDVSMPVMLSDKTLRFVLALGELKRWLLAFLRSEFGRSQIELLSSGNQESMRNIGQERIRQIAVPLPPTSELEEILACLTGAVDAERAQSASIEHALRQSAAQRKNILQAAFSGQLVPQDPNDEPASVLLERIRAERMKQPAKSRKPRVSRKAS